MITCKACGQKVSDKIIAERKRIGRERQAASIKRRKEIGLNVGRPRVVTAEEVRELREKGLSYRQIAKRLNISTSPVGKILRETP